MKNTPKKILITPRSLTAAGLNNVPELGPLLKAGYDLVSGPAGRIPTQAEQFALLSEGVVGYIAGVETITAEVLSAAPSLRVISRNGIGTDAIDLAAAENAGISVEVAHAANAQGVAELTVLHMLASIRSYTDSTSSVRLGAWDRALGGEIAGSTIGVVGLGSIGRTVARIVSSFGAEVIASDPFVDSSELASIVKLPELFKLADLVTLHSPPSKHPIVDRKVVATMKDGAILINTARSALVDENAVLEALQTGKISAYAVDAFDTEPPELTQLIQHPRCFPTPHLGGYTRESVHRATAYAVENLLGALKAR